MTDKKLLKQVAKANEAFRDTLKAKAATEEELRAYQERLSVIGRSKYLREAPRTKREEIQFSRLLFKKEPYVSAACELLIEAAETEQIYVNRKDVSAEDDILMQSLNWYLNEYMFLDTFNFIHLWNSQFIDWFVAGEELYAIDKHQTVEYEVEGKVVRLPAMMTPISTEYLKETKDPNISLPFGLPAQEFQLDFPREQSRMFEKDKRFRELIKAGSINEDSAIFIKRMARLTDERGKSLVEAAHEPVRTKYTKIAREMTQGRTNLVKDMVFLKYGEKGEDGIERTPEEMLQLAQEIKKNVDAGLAMAVVPPDVNVEGVTVSRNTEGDVDDKEIANLDILAGMRMFGVFITGTGTLPAGLKETPLMVIRNSIMKARNDRARQMMPRLINIIYSLNKELFETEGISREGIQYTFSEIELRSLEAIRMKLREWENGVISTEDYHGKEFSSKLANRIKENEQYPNEFLPRQLSHTLSGNPQESIDDEEERREEPTGEPEGPTESE